MTTIEPGTYEKRPVRYLGLLRVGEWRLKEYGISHAGERPESELVAAAQNVAAQRLSANANPTNHYGVGFLGIHEGKTGNFVFVDWWADENELHHHLFVSPSDRPADLEYKTPTGLSACVWDLVVTPGKSSLCARAFTAFESCFTSASRNAVTKWLMRRWA